MSLLFSLLLPRDHTILQDRCVKRKNLIVLCVKCDNLFILHPPARFSLMDSFNRPVIFVIFAGIMFRNRFAALM